jgi:catechol 2,3-dioxygenase-like lactoylglutathione lyase family enzyme
MKIKTMTVYVEDQEKARRFYTDVLGFTKKADFSNGGFRWLTTHRMPFKAESRTIVAPSS